MKHVRKLCKAMGDGGMRNPLRPGSWSMPLGIAAACLALGLLGGQAGAQTGDHGGHQPPKHMPMHGEHAMDKDPGHDSGQGGHKQHEGGNGAGGHGAHGGHGGHGGHGMIVPESRDFPTFAYDEDRAPRPPEKSALPEGAGNATAGKAIAYNPRKGRCLACHVLGPDSEQPGDLGPDLSDYGNRGLSRAYTYQQIWDARVHNPESAMPPFGTNDLLSPAEVMDIVAYLHTLSTQVVVSDRPAEPQRSRRERVFVAGEDLSVADDYVDAGGAVFRRPGNNGRACASCHAAGKAGDDINNAAARFPHFDEAEDAIVTLEDRVNICRETHMDSHAIEYGSHTMNVLTSYLRHLALGERIQVSAVGPAAEAFERGKSLYYRRAGQLNYSCAECHVKHSGKWLRGQYLRPLDDVSGDWPKHFIAGHDLGLISLQQRIRHCQIVTRTYPLELGSREYAELEFYMTVLSEGTPVLAPTRSRLRGE